MANPSDGMSQDPGQSYSIASRLTCVKCGISPQIIAADGRDPVMLTVTCHGSKESRSIPRQELVFQQKFFENDQSI